MPVQRHPTTRSDMRKIIDGVSRVVRSTAGYQCCCEEETTYIQYRACDGGGLADLWEPLDSDYPKFIFNYADELCYYVYDDHPTSTTPGTLVGAKFRKEACDPCIGNCGDCVGYIPDTVRVAIAGVTVDCCGSTGATVGGTGTLTQLVECIWQNNNVSSFDHPCIPGTPGHMEVVASYGIFGPNTWAVTAIWEDDATADTIVLFEGAAVGTCDEAEVVSNANPGCAVSLNFEGVGGTATVTPL
jgi:hypothetical protein